MADVFIKLGKDIKVENTDNIIEISKQGRLVFSRGSVEWIPSKNHVNQYKFTWKEFAQALEATGTPTVVRKAVVKKPAAKKAVAKKASAAK